MSRKSRILVFLVITSATVVFATASFHPQASVKPPTSPSSTNPSTAPSLGVKAYTDWFPNDDGVDCFRQERIRGSITLYFRAYASFPIAKATLDLYQYQADGSLKLVNADAHVERYGNTAKISLRDSSTPPHLGPGPYVATISASDSAAAQNPGNGTSVTVNHYYDTFKYSQQECWQE